MATGARTQATRAMILTPPPPVAKDGLLLVGITGHEAISHLFSFHLDLLAENGKAIALDQAVGKKATAMLGLSPQPPRYFNGIVSRISQGRRDEVFTSYQMEIVPEAWLLTRMARSRTFQQKTVPQILAEVFAGLNVQLKLDGGPYEPRDYCVQYRETDFNFASRLMEEEGIFYYFTHTETTHLMVVTDSGASFPSLPQPVVYEELEGGGRDEMRVHDWDKTQELRSTKYTLWDHTFELPHQHLEASKTILPSVNVGTVPHQLTPPQGAKLELYDYPGEYAQRFDGVNPGGGDRPDVGKVFQDNKRTAAIRMEQEAALALATRGVSNVAPFLPGTRFDLTRHWDANGPYVLTSVHHAARMTGEYRSGGGELSYQNSFQAIPSALPFRPERVTPKPVIHGTQTAVVVGPSGEEIFPDKYSRVKVQFHWDRLGKNDPNSSCWVRVSTPWAGKNWGMVSIPRVGQEVVVAFEEGDPDRPLIVGSVYNADMMPPYDLPANKTQSGVKTRSSKQGDPTNFNELRFEDKKGHEQVFLHAEKDFVREVENNDTLTIGIPGPSLTDGSQTLSVYNNRTETVKNGNETITVEKGNRTVNLGMGDDAHNIKQGNRSVVIDMGNDSLRIKMGNQDVKLDLGQSTTEAMQSITLKVGQSSIVIDQMGVTIKGMMISVEGQIQTEVKGMMTSISGDAMLTAKGGITMIN